MKQLYLRLIMCGTILALMMTACSSPTPTRVPKPKTLIETRLSAGESHTRIRKPEQQSYFLEHAEQVDLPVPISLVGGN